MKRHKKKFAKRIEDERDIIGYLDMLGEKLKIDYPYKQCISKQSRYVKKLMDFNLNTLKAVDQKLEDKIKYIRFPVPYESVFCAIYGFMLGIFWKYSLIEGTLLAIPILIIVTYSSSESKKSMRKSIGYRRLINVAIDKMENDDE